MNRAEDAFTTSSEARALVNEIAERFQARVTIQAPPVLPRWGERPLSNNERNAIAALINYQAELHGVSLYGRESP